VNTRGRGLGWGGIARLGLVQVAIGAVIVIMTSTLNRVMVVELALPAVVPGFLVGLHFAVQLLRPRMGFGSDRAGRRIPWIVGGMALLALSGVGAAVATAWMTTNRSAGLLLALFSFLLLGVGVSASSTPFLAYLAERVDEGRMAGAAALTWIMMIAGIIITAGVAGTLLDPFSPTRLVAVTAGVAGVAMLLTLAAVAGRKDGVIRAGDSGGSDPASAFREAVRELWSDPRSRRFAIFVFVSMMAYSAQEIILEPYAGHVFGLTPGESTRIAGLQSSGILLGMIGGAVLCSRFGGLLRWSAVGCVASAVALLALVFMPAAESVSGMRVAIFGLGLGNGVYAVAAIGAMMGLTVKGGTGGAGLRMGFWGASQAIAYGAGGFLGAAASDVGRSLLGSPAMGYGIVFLGEAILFLVAAGLVLSVGRQPDTLGATPPSLPQPTRLVALQQG